MPTKRFQKLERHWQRKAEQRDVHRRKAEKRRKKAEKKKPPDRNTRPPF